MKTEITEKERNAIESYANNHAGISDDKFANLAKKYDAYNLCDAVQKGAEFALAELRKPSESEPIGRTDEELVQKISKLLLDYTKEHYESTVMLDCNYLAAEIIKLTPNIPTYYPYDTEMFQELFNYMAGEHNVTLLESEMDDIMRICLKIVGGKFAPSSRCQENHVNVELLDAAKYFKNIVVQNWNGIDESSIDASKHINSIINAEKQMKV